MAGHFDGDQKQSAEYGLSCLPRWQALPLLPGRRLGVRRAAAAYSVVLPDQREVQVRAAAADRGGRRPLQHRLRPLPGSRCLETGVHLLHRRVWGVVREQPIADTGA